MVLTGVFYSVFSFTQSLWSGAWWIALSRVVMGINHIIGVTLLMNIVPARFRGRTFSTKEAVVIFTMVLSMLLAGVGQRYIGPRSIALVAGILTLITGAIWLLANLSGIYNVKIQEATTEATDSEPDVPAPILARYSDPGEQIATEPN
jgi:MFS family permease